MERNESVHLRKQGRCTCREIQWTAAAVQADRIALAVRRMDAFIFPTFALQHQNLAGFSCIALLGAFQ